MNWNMERIWEQAENAKFEGAEISDKGAGFHGKSFVKLGNKPGAFIEWYQENDGGAGNADLYFRYSGVIEGKPGADILLLLMVKQ